MKKNLPLLTLLVAVLVSAFSINIFAQNKASGEIKQVQTPNSAERILQKYIEISSLPMDKRRKLFIDLSAKDKADLFKLHLAFQFVKRPNLSNEQKDLVLESISVIKSDSYDLENSENRIKAQQDVAVLETKAKSLFKEKEAYEIFASLGGNSEDALVLQKYLDISKLNSMNDRRELFTRSSSTEKSNLWRVHFAYSLVKFSELNKFQIESILSLISMATPELYEIPKDSEEWKIKVEKPVQTLSDRILSIFSKDLGTRIFLNLGSEIPVVVKDSSDLMPAHCECARNSIPQCWTQSCFAARCSITPGCGVLWVWDCDGLCPPG